MFVITTELIIIVLLVLANGIFAMSEMAVVASRKVRLQQRAEDGDTRAKAALDLARNPAQFLSTVQVGITLVGVLAGAFGGARLAEKVAVPVSAIPVLAPYADAVAFGLVVAVITFLSLILGELVPKNIALNWPETIAAWVARPMMLLAAIGIYGVMNYSVSTRTREIGIRMALGANRFEVLNMILKQGMFLTGIGFVLGLSGSYFLTRTMESLLFGVSARDQITFVAISLLLAIVALAACYIPARRATKVDPMIALRYE